MTMHEGDRLRHQPSSALAASEKTSYVYPKIDQIWLYDLGGFQRLQAYHGVLLEARRYSDALKAPLHDSKSLNEICRAKIAATLSKRGVKPLRYVC